MSRRRQPCREAWYTCQEWNVRRPSCDVHEYAAKAVNERVEWFRLREPRTLFDITFHESMVLVS
jgi:hypothetical protein